MNYILLSEKEVRMTYYFWMNKVMNTESEKNVCRK